MQASETAKRELERRVADLEKHLRNMEGEGREGEGRGGGGTGVHADELDLARQAAADARHTLHFHPPTPSHFPPPPCMQMSWTSPARPRPTLSGT